MFTQTIMITTVILLTLAGFIFLKKSKEVKYISGKTLSYGLFCVGLGIFCYSIRDIFVQLEKYDIQLIILRIGSFFHILGGFLVLWFFSKEFTSEKISKAIFLICLIAIILTVIWMLLPFWKSEIIQAPFEPFPYKVVRNYISGPGLIIETILVIFASTFLVGIIFYNALKLEDKNLRKKGLLYGLSFLFLFLPIFICNLISPIYARWGYLIGAILLFLTLRLKI